MYGSTSARDRGAWSEIPLLCSSKSFQDEQRTNSDLLKATGLRKFLNRRGPIISLGPAPQVPKKQVRQVLREGSSLDSSAIVTLPNAENSKSGSASQGIHHRSMEIQKGLGADVLGTIEYDNLETLEKGAVREWSFSESLRWQLECLELHRSENTGKGLFANVHINCSSEAEKERSLERTSVLSKYDFDGYFVSLADVEAEGLLETVLKLLPPKKAKHIRNARSLEVVARSFIAGADMFDSELPVRMGSEHRVFTRDGVLDLTEDSCREQFSRMDQQWGDPSFSIAYMHHLIKAYEPLAPVLCALHNMNFLTDFINDLPSRVAAEKVEQMTEAV
uniref:tRNA-guanine(15) transglycosylase-like domain-containing protein n=1 Tax=Rhodosorus marinus TaxID=101924 RepID=A0A7S0BK17_9RHOD